MRVVDVQLSFPSILIAVFLAAFLPPSLLSVILVLAVTRWALVARLTRAITVRASKQGYVEAALVSGFSTLRRSWGPASRRTSPPRSSSSSRPRSANSSSPRRP